jgi:tRNA threonylcarbamoyl adenosine modification protein YeaZ
MRILAIDTALSAVSVCVLDAGERSAVASEVVAMEKGHAEALLPMVARVMARTDRGFSSIGRVAVTVGPGSFTGIRIGIAAARGIALARGIAAVGVSTLSALASPHLADEFDGIVASVVNAKRDHVYFSAYGPGGRVLTSPRLLPIRDACRLLSGGRVRLVGSGANLLRDEALQCGGNVAFVDNAEFPDIMAVARLGLIADPADAPAYPIYLKAPDAKLGVGRAIPRASA